MLYVASSTVSTTFSTASSTTSTTFSTASSTTSTTLFTASSTVSTTRSMTCAAMLLRCLCPRATACTWWTQRTRRRWCAWRCRWRRRWWRRAWCWRSRRRRWREAEARLGRCRVLRRLIGLGLRHLAAAAHAEALLRAHRLAARRGLHLRRRLLLRERSAEARVRWRGANGGPWRRGLRAEARRGRGPAAGCGPEARTMAAAWSYWGEERRPRGAPGGG